jgi:hypothetical protein
LERLRTKSFHHESVNNRRVFLRSYPLQLGEQDEYNKEDTVRVADGSNQKKLMKKSVHIIACIPIGLKTPTALISA